MQQNYRKTLIPKFDFNKVDFNKVTLRHGCSPVNSLHNFGMLFPKITSEELFMKFIAQMKIQLQNQKVLLAILE